MTAPIIRTDTSQLDDLARRLAQTSDNLVQAHITPALQDAVEMVVAEAKSLSSWSSQIPQTIKGRATPYGKKAASVVTAGPRTARRGQRRAASGNRLSGGAHAGLYEYGSAESGGRYVRRPLFGNRDWWYNTPTRPFLRPAYERREDEIVAEIEAGLGRALRERDL
jgi:hypothetical protein